MIDITESPNFISFAGNPVIYEACSDNYLVSLGSRGYFELVVSGIDTALGHSFHLQFAGKKLVFQTADFTGFDGLLFEVGYPGQTFSDFASNIYQCFLENYDIQKYFDVTLDGPGVSNRKILLQAKQSGTDGSVVFSNNTVTGVAQGANTPGTDDLYRDYFAILCLIRDSQNNSIGEDIKPADFIGCARFDLSDYIKSKFAAWEMQRFEFPELTGNVKVHGWDYLLKYRVSFAESIAGKVKGLQSDGWKYCLAGGLNHELLTSLNEKYLEYFSIAANRQKFLSWLPLAKYSRSGVLEKLFFLFQDNPSAVQYRLVVIINFTDGTHTVVNATPQVTYPAFTVVEFKVGYDHLDLVNAQYGKVVRSWEVFIMDSNDDYLSERRIFINDSRVFENEKVFFYRNSFSAYDTFRFTGKSELNLEYERSVGSVKKEEKFSFFNAPSRQFSSKESEICKANSGWISLTEKNCLRELLLSTEAYEQIGKELFQIVVRSAKITPFLKDGEYLYNLEIEYERAYENSFFSVHVPESSANPVVLPQPLTWDNMEESFDSMEITFDQVEY
ncbi:MAG: hypothetical protein EOM90_11430 [Alphaproteobacteria bacterium]|nr:hypothetical protein [Alphaproteobacteria bacterium]